MDRNGYNKSIMKTEYGRCYICTRYCETVRHEIFHGSSRSISKKYGMWIDVCPSCHIKIHAGDNTEYRYLKESAQAEFEKRWGHDKFINLIMRNYL